MIFDTHAHYDDEAFDEDRDEVLTSLREWGVGTVVNVGASMEGSRRSVSLSEQYEFVYSAVGVHPDEVGELREEDMEWMREQLQKPKVVAVGEIGLDYYWDKEGHDLQKKWFLRQLELAKELKKPVIIHSREAAADTMELLKETIDYVIFAVLGLMGFITIWLTIERLMFFRTLDASRYATKEDYDEALTNNLTTLYIIYSNAPYVGLLGTVIGIMITFYDMGTSGTINASDIMTGLSLALKATALGLAVAIPTLIIYNALQRRINVLSAKWRPAAAAE